MGGLLLSTDLCAFRSTLQSPGVGSVPLLSRSALPVERLSSSLRGGARRFSFGRDRCRRDTQVFMLSTLCWGAVGWSTDWTREAQLCGGPYPSILIDFMVVLPFLFPFLDRLSVDLLYPLGE